MANLSVDDLADQLARVSMENAQMKELLVQAWPELGRATAAGVLLRLDIADYLREHPDG
jgi:hypothetical protein